MILVPSASLSTPGAIPLGYMVMPAGSGGLAAPPGYTLLVPWTPGPVSATPAPFAEPAVTTRTIDYHWMTVVTDVSAAGLILMALPMQSGTPAGLGMGTYALGAPIVHWAHGNVGRGFASLGLRLGAPFAGGVVGAAVACHSSGSDHDVSGLGDGYRCASGIALGSLLGLGAGLVIDHGVLPSTKTVAEPKAVSWSPTIAPSKEGMTLGMVGTW